MPQHYRDSCMQADNHIGLKGGVSRLATEGINRTIPISSGISKKIISLRYYQLSTKSLLYSEIPQQPSALPPRLLLKNFHDSQHLLEAPLHHETPLPSPPLKGHYQQKGELKRRPNNNDFFRDTLANKVMPLQSETLNNNRL